MQQVLELVRSFPALLGVAGAVCVYLLLRIFDREPRPTSRQRTLLGVGASGLAGLGLAACLFASFGNIRTIRDWDFLCFWTYGRALADGDSPYDVSVLRQIAEPYSPSEEFQRENYCLYPPPCVMQFLPLGFLPIKAAAALWYAVQWAAAAGVVILLGRLLDANRGGLRFLISAALVFWLPSTVQTFHYAQSTFLIVASVLLALFANHPAVKGFWIGLATWIKPIGAILALDLMVKREWKAMVGMIVPLLAATAFFLSLQGWSGLERYRQRNPLAEEISGIFYTEDANQSLLATSLRMTGTAPGQRPVLFPPFVVVAGILTIVTLAVVVRLPRELQHASLSCLLALALLVYPGALNHYSVCLLVPIGMLWSQRDGLRFGPHAVVMVIALAYGLVWTKLAFYANLTVWTALMVGLSQLKSKSAAVPQPN